MKIKTKDLIGAALDWAVAVATGCEPDISKIKPDANQKWVGFHLIDNAIQPFIGVVLGHRVGRSKRPYISHRYEPSTVWGQGSPLIEQFQIFLSPPHIVFATKIVDGEREPADRVYDGWTAKISARVAKKPPLIEGLPGLCGLYGGEGPTPLIAICRAVVAHKLGEEVEVPDELVKAGLNEGEGR